MVDVTRRVADEVEMSQEKPFAIIDSFRGGDARLIEMREDIS